MVFKILYTLSFLDFLSLALIQPNSANHLLALGGSRVVLGVLTSIICLQQLVLGPLIGSWSDSKGRKPLLLMSLIFTLPSYVLIGVDNLYIFMLSRIIHGFSCHTHILLKALIADNAAPENQVAIFGKMGATAALAYVLGPITGGHLVPENNSFHNLSLVLCGLSLINIAVAYCLPNVIPKEENPTEDNLKSQLSSAFTKLLEIDFKTYGDLFGLKYLAESTYSIFYQSFILILRHNFRATLIDIGYMLAFHSSMMIIANLTIAKIRNALYQGNKLNKINVHGMLSFMILFGLLYLFPSFWNYGLFMIPFSIVRSLIDTSWNEELIKRSSSQDRGVVMGAFESVMQLAGLSTPLINGVVAEMYGYNASIFLCVLPTSLGCLLALYINIKKNESNYMLILEKTSIQI